jgi:hypothetical protein
VTIRRAPFPSSIQLREEAIFDRAVTAALKDKLLVPEAMVELGARMAVRR